MIYKFLVCIYLISFLSPDGHSYISWRQRRMLEWKDFIIKSSISSSEERMAVSQCGFNTQTKTEGNKLFITIDAIFDKDHSWVRKGSQDDYSLRHEQGHFDIAEVNARKYRNAVMNFTFKRDSYHRDLDSLHKFYYTVSLKEQAQYDLETSHGLNKIIQEQWVNRIMRELEHEMDYWDTEIVKTFVN